MKKIKRVVSTGFWTDKKVVDMFSVEDRYFYLYLLTNPNTTQLGIYELPISTASNETGYNKDVVRVLLDRFENKYDMIKYSHETGEVAIKNYLRHSIVKGGAPVKDCLVKELKQVKDVSLIYYVYDYISNIDIENNTVLDVIKYISSIYINNDIENENENERIVNESSKKKIHQVIPPTVDMVRDYCIERGNCIDPEAFCDFYQSKGWKVGKEKMKDWMAAVRTWEKNRKGKEKPNEFDEWRNA